MLRRSCWDLGRLSIYLQHCPDKNFFHKESRTCIDILFRDTGMMSRSFQTELQDGRLAQGHLGFDEEALMKGLDHSVWVHKCRCGVYAITDK
ncbi:uncharacterized protein EV420DRAFT_1316346 [Desarmillaria tabescens]|uniref:Uncharacterized protein n=1 Tax=Armillaria tabescens TaxID=1929756 RepID=A0AA39JB20_ARMTA|nr:uncharacterized protein EV420DRAFT_1316346 [Desarmillaria tabescens]KAK0439034.1 hypothetical protein EV420DRAFT_1316346 [Desarmillaria tabescens]